MKRFIVAAAVAVALGLGYSGKADAQINYGRSMMNSNGMMTMSPTMMSGGFSNHNMFAQPIPGVRFEPTFGQSLGVNRYDQLHLNRYDQLHLNRFDQLHFNQFDRMGFRNNFSQPNFFRPNAFQPSFFGTTNGGFNTSPPNGGFNNGFHMMGHGHR